MLRVERLAARVTLEDPATCLAQAELSAAAGDESWQRWITEYRGGAALIARVDTTLEAADGDGPLVINVTHRGVFLEKDRQPPKVEQQVGEMVAVAFPALVRELADRGHRIDQHLLGQMYVHVELAHDIRTALNNAGAGRLEFDPSKRG